MQQSFVSSSPGDRRSTITARRPLPGITLAFVAGTALGLRLSPPVAPALTAAALIMLPAAISSFCARRRPKNVAANNKRLSGPELFSPAEQHKSALTFTAPLLLTAVVFTAAAAAALHTARPSSRTTAVGNLDRNAEIALQIQVTGDPVMYKTISQRPAWNVPAKISAFYDADKDTWRRASGRLTARWREIDFRPDPRYGDRWLIRGRYYSELQPAAAGGNELFWARRTERLETDSGNHWVAQCFVWRRAAADFLSQGIEHFPERVAVMRALLLGLRHELDASLRERFAATGTLHVIAISGLHVGVMSALFIFALQCMGISRVNRFYFLVPLLIAYTLGTGARPSAVRACIMALAYWSALPMGRRPDAPSALALAALLILGYDPRQLAQPGFLFSFTVVAGLLIFARPLHELLTRKLRIDRTYRELPAAGNRARREMANLLYRFAGLAVVSAVAWVMAAPLSARFFGRVSLLALPANLLVVPLAFLIVVTGCLALVSGAVIPAAGIVFNHANLIWTGILLRILSRLSEYPGADMTLAIPGWILPLWYGVLVMLGWRLKYGGKPAGREDCVAIV